MRLRSCGAGIGQGGEGNFVLLAPVACGLHALVDGLGHAVGAEVDQVIQRDFRLEHLHHDRPAEFTGLARGDRVIIGGDSILDLAQPPVGGGFDDLEVVVDETIIPFAALADGPDDPKLIGARRIASSRLPSVT